jgi:hypothetical protein
MLVDFAVRFKAKMIGPSNVADDRFDFRDLLDVGQESWTAEKIFALEDPAAEPARVKR